MVIDGLTATHFVVTAQVDQQGFNAFILAADRPGVTVTPVRSLDGGWLAQVEFDSVEVDMPLLEEKTALEDVIRALDHGIVAVCAEALGLMNRMLALTASYLQTRQQFGKPIGTFQSLQHRFAEMVVATEQSRSATFMAAAALGNEDATARKIDVSAAKAMVCRHGRAVLEGAIQLHGGIGITDEYELSRYVRRMIEIEMFSNEKGNYFEPSEITARQGDVLQFELKTGVHNVNFLPDSNPGKTGLPAPTPLLQLPDQTIEVAVTMGPGTYYFHCDPHAALGMKGHLTVTK